MSASVIVYTDGACKGNPGPGGWGALLQYKGKPRELVGGEAHSTNNRMELTAVIRALVFFNDTATTEIYTDSQYVKQGIERWIHTWKSNGWKTSARKAVKNADLWRALDVGSAQQGIFWHRGKGDAQRPGHNRAHELSKLGGKGGGEKTPKPTRGDRGEHRHNIAW